MRGWDRMRVGAVIALLMVGGCSVKRYAITTIGDMLSSGGAGYERDNDIALVGEALPFSLKLMESVLVEAPTHQRLLLTAARGFVLYTSAYVQYDADQMALEDLERARALRDRARRLYLRALGYALRAAEHAYPGFADRLLSHPKAAAGMITGKGEQDMALLYWTAVSLGLAISVSKNAPALLARLPEVEALIEQALALDETWQAGALHEFKIIWETSQLRRADPEAIRYHYERTLALSQGRLASVHVAYAEAVALPSQDRAGFVTLLEKALAIDPEAAPEHRLLNLLAQRRARWLLARIDELFL